MIDSRIRDLIFDKVLAAAIKSIQAAVPFFSLPVVRVVFEFAVKKIAQVLYKHMSEFVVFSLIDSRVGKENADYKESLSDLKVVAEKPNATQEEINAAEEKFSNALGALISLGPKRLRAR